MSLVVNVSCEGVRIPVAAARLAELCRRVMKSEGVKDAMISIAFITSPAIAKLNKQHLDKRGATDVIAFGLTPMKGSAPVVGDIYISSAVARTNAKRLGLSVREELARLVVHGTLHVLGYTHPEDGDRTQSVMWRKQESIMRRGIPLVPPK